MITVVDSFEIEGRNGDDHLITSISQITLNPKKFLKLPLSEIQKLEILSLSTKGCFLDDETFGHVSSLISQMSNLTYLSLDFYACKFEVSGFQFIIEGITNLTNLVNLTLNLGSN